MPEAEATTRSEALTVTLSRHGSWVRPSKPTNRPLWPIPVRNDPGASINRRVQFDKNYVMVVATAGLVFPSPMW